MNLGISWNVISGWLFPKQNPDLIINEEQLEEAVCVICQDKKLALAIQEWFLQIMQQNISSDISPKFWQYFKKPISSDQVSFVLKEAINGLTVQVKQCLDSVDRLQSVHKYLNKHLSNLQPNETQTYEKHQLLTMVKAIVFYKVNKNFLDSLNVLYCEAFRSFDAAKKSNESDEVECLTCDGCELERENCTCAGTLEAFHHINSQLRELDLLECLSGAAVTSLIHQRIKQHVEHTCKGNFEVQYLSSLQKWLDSNVVGWLALLYGECGRNTTVTGRLQSHKDRLYHYMYEVFAKVAIGQLFDIIIEYPESEAALQDLKTCLEKVSLRNLLVKSLKNALETRLLHPGVNTTDILTAYISGIRALRVLDPAGVLLDLVCQPVRTYLRNRDDTVKCIVSSLTEDGSTELSDELIKPQPLMLDESFHSDEEEGDWEAWQPDPVDADPLKSCSQRSSDIISMLVNIYGSKDLFVNEYQTLLADRILTHFNYDTAKEIRYLELLKLRFGESQLHHCEVMLKDVAESRRINVNIVEKKEREKRSSERNSEDTPAEEEIAVNGMILSAQFWPTFREEKLEIPEEMKVALDNYTKSFEALKGNRTLNWRPHLGLVDVELEMKDRILNLKVSPTHATIIWHFQSQNKWSVEELSVAMHMPSHALRRKVAFWQSHGLLKEESPDTFVLVEEQRGRHHDASIVIEEEETESAMASAQDLKQEEYQVIWQYIVGMLTNLESLPLDRIHSMLKMFAMQGPGSECSQHELKALLDKKVKEQKLVLSTGVYRLVKST